MCYYSTTMRNVRDVKQQEDLYIGTHMSHTVLKSAKDDRAVCVKGGSEIHFEKLEIQRDRLSHEYLCAIRPHLGKEFHTRFVQYSGNGYAADAIMVGPYKIHIAWLKDGLKCYVGPKKPDLALEAKLGVDEQTMKGNMLDHGPQHDDVPTFRRSVLRALGFCSIQP